MWRPTKGSEHWGLTLIRALWLSRLQIQAGGLRLGVSLAAHKERPQPSQSFTLLLARLPAHLDDRDRWDGV